MRFKLCHLLNFKENQVKTAYVKEKDSIVGLILAGWEIISVSTNSVSEEVLKNINIEKKENY